ncbi:MAG TPA: putative lipid II flippase FtsW [Terracidiphilus sp.]|jgi:cell division protein FtsW|nr:putative lipid II flippase FtsW [Terracidiphilus sp.]
MAKRVGVDKWMFFTTLLLVVAGLVMVFSASAVVAQERYHSPYTFLIDQAVWAVAGGLAMLALMHIDARRYNSPRFIYPALSITTLLLVAVFLFPGSHNTHRWIRFGEFFTFQPSEIAKPVLVLFLAWFLHNRLDAMRDWKNTLLRAAIVPVLFMLLIVKQPDLGTALVLGGVTAMMLVLAGMEWKYLAGAALAAMPFLCGLLFLVPWRRARMLAFMNPAADPQGAGFHINQSLIAVGTGGFAGRGYMEGMQKLFYLPEASTDFIFANIAEELGFIGAMLIVTLFVVFAARGLRAVFRSQDPFSRMVAFGITTTILLQAFFNISVVLSLVPTKGIPLPLISKGGTSLFFTLASIGILLNITRQVE